MSAPATALLCCVRPISFAAYGGKRGGGRGGVGNGRHPADEPAAGAGRGPPLWRHRLLRLQQHRHLCAPSPPCCQHCGCTRCTCFLLHSRVAPAAMLPAFRPRSMPRFMDTGQQAELAALAGFMLTQGRLISMARGGGEGWGGASEQRGAAPPAEASLPALKSRVPDREAPGCSGPSRGGCTATRTRAASPILHPRLSYVWPINILSPRMSGM